MARSGRVRVTFDADTSAFDRDVKGASSTLTRFGRSVSQHDATTRRATATTSRFSSATGKLGSSLATAAKAGLAAGAAYVSISQAKAAITTTQDLAKATLGLQKNLGLAGRSAGEWAAAASARGVDTTKLGMAFKTLSSQVEAARNGSTTAQAMFKSLGVSMSDLDKGSKDVSGLMVEIADGMDKAGAGTERMSTVSKLFGRSYAGIAPMIRDGSKALQENLQATEKYGSALHGQTLKDQEKLRGSLIESKDAWEGIQVQFTSAVTPALETVNKKFQGLARVMADKDLSRAEKFQKIGDKIGGWAQDAFDAFVEVLPKIVSEAGQRAPKIAEAFVKGFLDAPILGQLALGTMIFGKLGGARAIGTFAGKGFGKGFVVAAALSLPLLIPDAYKLGQKMGEAIRNGLGGTLADIIKGTMTTTLSRQDVRDNFLKGASSIEAATDALKKMGYSTQQAGDISMRWLIKMGDAQQTAGEGFEKLGQRASASGKQVGKASEKAGHDVSRFSDSSGAAMGDFARNADSASDRVDRSMKGVGSSSQQMKDAVVSSVGSAASGVADGFTNIFTNLNSALKSLAVEPVAFSIAKGIKSGDVNHKARGGMLPGYSPVDNVPAMLRSGEAVLTPEVHQPIVETALNMTYGMGLSDLFRQTGAPYAKGGVVDRTGVRHYAKGGKVGAGVGPMTSLANRFDAANEPYLLGGGHGAFLTSPAPVDCSGAVSAVLHAGGLLEGAPMDTVALANWGKPASGSEPLVVATRPITGAGGHTVMKINGRVFGTSSENPNGGAGWLSNPDPRAYVSGAVLRTMNIGAGAVPASIARAILQGPDGPLKTMGQKALDKVRSAASRYVASKMPQGTGGGADTGEVGKPIKSLPASLQKYNHVWPHNPPGDAAAWSALPTMPFNKIAELAEWAGLPGITMAQITKGESGGKPGSLEIGASGPGGTRGVGLWAITPPYANGDRYPGGTLSGDYQPEMFNPVYNAIVAKQMAPNGPNAGIWHGSGAVTDWNAHYTGPMMRKGGIVRRPRRFAKGGFAGLRRRFARGGLAGRRRYTKGGYHGHVPSYTSPWPTAPGPSKPPGYDEQLAALDYAAALAETTATTTDDAAVLIQRQKLLSQRKSQLLAKLARKDLSPAERKRLLGELASVQGDINTTVDRLRTIRADNQPPPADTAPTDTTPADTSEQDRLDAQRANTEALKALADEIAKQNALVNGALSSDYTQALAYIGDLLGGAIGGIVAPRLSTAGAGSVVRS